MNAEPEAAAAYVKGQDRRQAQPGRAVGRQMKNRARCAAHAIPRTGL